jgi:hypothetical protein
MAMKFPMTPSGIELVTIQLVAQSLELIISTVIIMCILLCVFLVKTVRNSVLNMHMYIHTVPVPVAARSRRRSLAARLLRFRVRIPPGAWMFDCCECCVLSGRGLCDGLITRPEESYRLWRVIVCNQETSQKRGG